MKGLVFYTDNRHEYLEIEGLQHMQELVDGGIEYFETGLEGVGGYCNEFSKYECVPNIKATKTWHNLLGYNPQDTLYGNIIFCRDEEDLKPEDITAIRKACAGWKN